MLDDDKCNLNVQIGEIHTINWHINSFYGAWDNYKFSFPPKKV